MDRHGADWDQYLQATAFAVRSSINNSTNCTPAELVLGSNPVRPIDLSASEGEVETARVPRAKTQAQDFANELTRKRLCENIAGKLEEGKREDEGVIR